MTSCNEEDEMVFTYDFSTCEDSWHEVDLALLTMTIRLLDLDVLPDDTSVLAASLVYSCDGK